MSCSSCGYNRALLEGPCEVCIRNPSLASRKFQPKTWKGQFIEKAVDLYISKEHLGILDEEMRRLIQQTLGKITPTNPPIIPGIQWGDLTYQGQTGGGATSFWTSSTTSPYASAGTLATTFSDWATDSTASYVWVTSPSGIIQDIHLDLLSTDCEEEKSESPKVSSKDVLECLDGMEIGETG